MDKDRFNLEQEILDCWSIVTDLRDVSAAVLENERWTTDNTANVLTGISELYDIKFDKLFRTMETLIKNNKLQ